MMRNTIKVLVPLATLVLAAPGTATARDTTFDVTLTGSQTDLVSLQPGIPTQTGLIRVDAAGSVSILFRSPSKTLSVELISPSNASLVSGNTTYPEGVAAIYPDPNDPDTKGSNYYFSLDNPEPGDWIYNIVENGALPHERAVLIETYSTSAIRSGMVGGGQDYPVDRPISLALVTADASSLLTGLSISGSLHKANDPSFTAVPVTFYDDGTNGGDQHANDGMYTTTFLPGQTGKFIVKATASGNSGGNAFDRTASAVFDVQPVMARLDGTFTDAGIDTNADPLYDALGVTVGIDVTEAGDYRVAVTLKAANGATTTASTNETLAAGSSTVQVRFTADQIKSDLAVDGPYAVSDVVVERLGGDRSITSDVNYDLGNTAAYTLGQLQRPYIDYKYTGTATGRDTNFDGQYEYLDVTLDVNFFYGTFYSWTARLIDANGTELSLSTRNGFFSAGDRSLFLRFDGHAIGANGVDGPYRVVNLIVYGFVSGKGYVSTIIDDALTTPAFTADQFEGFVSDSIPPTLTVTVTPTDLGSPNHKMVEVIPTITVTDNVDPDPQVTFVGVTSSESEDALGDGHTAPDIEITSDGRIFLRAERSGLGDGRVYTLMWSAVDDAGNVANTSVEVTVGHDKGK